MTHTLLVTVGTTRFDALIDSVSKRLNDLTSLGIHRIFIQHGHSPWVPTPNVESTAFIASLDPWIQQSTLILSHAGSGSILEALDAHKQLVVVPNPLLLDNHQLELATRLEQDQHLQCATVETWFECLERAIQEPQQGHWEARDSTVFPHWLSACLSQ
jgi:beta-1,4-N-acetylglucosaminyltransferase